jgi:hypothetical protein
VSDTPRTDELAKRGFVPDGLWIKHARELERENAELRADRDRLDWLEGEDGQSWTAKWYYWGEEWINRAAIDAARNENKS